MEEEVYCTPITDVKKGDIAMCNPFADWSGKTVYTRHGGRLSHIARDKYFEGEKVVEALAMDNHWVEFNRGYGALYPRSHVLIKGIDYT